MTEIRGIAYPLTIVNGTLTTAVDVDLLRGHIFSVLDTEVGERIMNPGYGSPDFLLNAVPEIHLVAQFLRQALERSIPEVNFEVSGSIGDDGAGILTVLWSIDGQLQPPLQFQLAT